MKKNLFVRIIIILNFVIFVAAIGGLAFYTFLFKGSQLSMKHYIFSGGLMYLLIFFLINMVLAYLVNLDFTQKNQREFLESQSEVITKVTDVLEAIDSQMRKSNKLIKEEIDMQEDFFAMIEIEKVKKVIEKSETSIRELNNKFNPEINFSKLEKLLEEIKYSTNISEVNKKNMQKLNEMNDNLKGIIFELKENADLIKELKISEEKKTKDENSEKGNEINKELLSQLASLMKEGQSGDNLVFADKSLEEEIKRILKIQGRNITKEDALEVKKLNISSKDVKNLKGIEHFKNLEELDLWGTSVSSILALSELKKLKILGLWKTNIKDISPLKDLKNLQYLNLKETDIVDLEPLSDSMQLRHINLKNTSIEDLTPIAELPNLQYLDITETFNLSKGEGSVNKDIIRELQEKGCDIPEY